MPIKWYNVHTMEIRNGFELGFKTNHKFILAPCLDCGKKRWVKFVKGKPRSPRCFTCARFNTRGYHGGKLRTKEGYIRVYLSPDDFFYLMGVKNPHQIGRYVLEHRLVMARALGRRLHLWEIVHHKHTKYPKGSKEDKSDNRIENLQLVSDDKHKQITILEKRISYLEAKLLSLGVKP